MHLEHLPSGSWRVTVNEQGQRRRGTAKTKGEARRLGAQMLLEMGAQPPANATVSDAIDAHLADSTYSARTRPEILRAAERLPAVFMARQVGDVEPVVIGALWRELAAAGHGPHAIKRVRDLLSQAWQSAIKLGWANTNPVVVMPPPAPDVADEVDPPSPAEVKALIAACGDRPVGLALRLAAATGVRRGELVGLQWADLRLDDGELVVRRSLSELAGGLVEGQGKTGRGGHRVIPLSTPLVRRLRKHPRIVGSPWLFQFSGEPWRPSYVSREFTRAMDKAELDHEYHLHSLRHYAATRWLAAGEPVAQVAYLLGHASPATTLRVYAHHIPAQSRTTVEAVSALLDD